MRVIRYAVWGLKSSMNWMILRKIFDQAEVVIPRIDRSTEAFASEETFTYFCL